ncbi:NAD(P)/FAD-dependent oxidoreductase [Roseibaca sp. Y0-43]|uniref:NAD(P)/FAD-dependent oxidoreductase n=1 Tax=Roseibaca sp. Y0-43 TaxID=2816854 RepID=UPI001D0CD694|nr:FAD-dependent oxidoreductase [Roseibaca sp. Y0-43]MCC1480799.1 FAD-binding oxidoreductase [Roseibaca sp. Y0-43]
MTATAQIAVIGAGVVGLACALRLHHTGHEVVIVAPEDEETGASYGNAGVIADYAVMPVGTPDVLRDLPRLLFDRDSPLAIRHAAMLTLAPWLLRFARECLPGRARANAQAIAALLAPSAQMWRDLAAEIGAREQLKAHGSIYLYETPKQAVDLAPRRSLGVTVEALSGAELGQLEPALRGHAGGAFFPNTQTVNDPATLLRALRAAVAEVPRIAARVERLERGAQGITLSGPGLSLRAGRVVLAAGAWSKQLAALAGDRVPLDTERGYHLEYDLPKTPLTRQTSPVARGWYFCPMQGRLRVAGTVELGGLTAPPAPHRWAVMERGARAILPDLPAPSRRWMGFRPSIPDSRPVIGPSRQGADVIHAYGHGHLGLTLAPVTAQLVLDLIEGRAPMLDPAPYRVDRF